MEPAFRNAKFEATGETKEWFGRTLYRIRAVAEIAALGIAVGDLGGWVEKEENLSVSGNAWVYGDAQVSGNAWVYGDAQVSGNAWVYGDAQVYGNARVYGNAWVYGNAQVSGNARVYGDARVYGNASKTPIHIIGLRWSITISDQDMQIGCQEHAIDRWWGFDDRLIARMDSGALEFWNEHKATLQALCAATGRPFVKAEKPVTEAA